MDAWTIGHLTLTGEPNDALPSEEEVAKHRTEQLAAASIEAAVLSDSGGQTITWRALPDAEIRAILEKR